MIVTPLKNYELMLGKIIPYIVLGYLQISVALLVASLIFKVPIRGNLLELYILTLFFITASLGLGLTISNLTKTQMQAMQMAFSSCCPVSCYPGLCSPARPCRI